MNRTPAKDGSTDRDPARQDESSDRPSPGSSGGVPAAEEDIGTEGAGTEPRDAADAQRSGSSPSTPARDERKAR